MGDTDRPPALAEWACLGALYGGTAHGWAVARRFRPDGDLGRVWQLSRPLTYRALDQLVGRAWIEPVGEEASRDGPTRTLLSATRTGRREHRAWVRTPVEQVRDLRSELLLKLVFARHHEIGVEPMLVAQRTIVDERLAALLDQSATDPDDLVTRWRVEMARAAAAFLHDLRDEGAGR